MTSDPVVLVSFFICVHFKIYRDPGGPRRNTIKIDDQYSVLCIVMVMLQIYLVFIVCSISIKKVIVGITKKEELKNSCFTISGSKTIP